jgi:hypothetical protein
LSRSPKHSTSSSPTPDFDEAKFRARVEELVAQGMSRKAAEEEATLEQQPGGDLVVD